MGDWLSLVVAGGHLEGMPLNYQVTDLGGRLNRKCRTASCYRLYALTETKPALIKDLENGAAIEVEVWDLPIHRVGEFLRDGVKAPLCLGDVELDDGTSEKGFLGEAYAVATARDITTFRGWRPFKLSEVPTLPP